MKKFQLIMIIKILISRDYNKLNKNLKNYKKYLIQNYRNFKI